MIRRGFAFCTFWPKGSAPRSAVPLSTPAFRCSPFNQTALKCKTPGQADSQKQAGFTLVELLVVMVVMSILSLLLANFVTNWLQAASLAQARTDLLSNAENALDTVNTDIRLSGSADQNNRWPDDNAPGNPLGWESTGQTLVLAKAAVDSDNDIIFSDAAKYISQKDDAVYYLDNGTLYRRIIASTDADDAAITTCPPASASASCPADKTVATGVSNFSITYYDADNTAVSPADARSVQLAITLSASKGGKKVMASYNTRMVFRNK